MNKHTPGPWVAYSAFDGGDIYVGTENGDINICQNASESDARLIAAAPDLLEALQLAIKVADDHGGDHFGFGEYVDIARAAIAKATNPG